jgi:hypothetical protein
LFGVFAGFRAPLNCRRCKQRFNRQLWNQVIRTDKALFSCGNEGDNIVT